MIREGRMQKSLNPGSRRSIQGYISHRPIPGLKVKNLSFGGFQHNRRYLNLFVHRPRPSGFPTVAVVWRRKQEMDVTAKKTLLPHRGFQQQQCYGEKKQEMDVTAGKTILCPVACCVLSRIIGVLDQYNEIYMLYLKLVLQGSQEGGEKSGVILYNHWRLADITHWISTLFLECHAQNRKQSCCRVAVKPCQSYEVSTPAEMYNQI